jgi:hypothetical protein
MGTTRPIRKVTRRRPRKVRGTETKRRAKGQRRRVESGRLPALDAVRTPVSPGTAYFLMA